jgi:hypothetical protein
MGSKAGMYEQSSLLEPECKAVHHRPKKTHRPPDSLFFPAQYLLVRSETLHANDRIFPYRVVRAWFSMNDTYFSFPVNDDSIQMIVHDRRF